MTGDRMLAALLRRRRILRKELQRSEGWRQKNILVWLAIISLAIQVLQWWRQR